MKKCHYFDNEYDPSQDDEYDDEIDKYYERKAKRTREFNSQQRASTRKSRHLNTSDDYDIIDDDYAYESIDEDDYVYESIDEDDYNGIENREYGRYVDDNVQQRRAHRNSNSRKHDRYAERRRTSSESNKEYLSRKGAPISGGYNLEELRRIAAMGVTGDHGKILNPFRGIRSKLSELNIDTISNCMTKRNSYLANGEIFRQIPYALTAKALAGLTVMRHGSRVSKSRMKREYDRGSSRGGMLSGVSSVWKSKQSRKSRWVPILVIFIFVVVIF